MKTLEKGEKVVSSRRSRPKKPIITLEKVESQKSYKNSVEEKWSENLPLLVVDG